VTAAHADALVLFGITGDLAYKKLFPALYHLVENGRVDGPIVGVASTEMSIADLQARIVASLGDSDTAIDDRVLQDLFGRLHYVSGDYRNDATFDQVAALVEDCHLPVCYLAIPPSPRSSPGLVSPIGPGSCSRSRSAVTSSRPGS
jgi:glucose-6-phosphate 1-dehydrogenase